MKWAVGRDTYGKVQTCSDGQPAYYRSDCGKFTVSRAITARGVLYDAWKVRPKEMPLPLLSAATTAREAQAACEAHA